MSGGIPETMKMFHVDSQGHVDIINIGPFDVTVKQLFTREV